MGVLSIILFCFFAALFCVYMLSRDDFVLLRKNVSLEQVFNYAFIGLFVGVLSARIIYVILHPSFRYLNPLVFLIFPYFPGLSIVGGVIGVMLFLFTISKKKKIPRGRLYDIFSLSFLLTIPFGYIITTLVTFIFKKKILLPDIFLTVGYIVTFIIVTMLFIKGKVQDWTVGLLCISAFCIFSVIHDFFSLHDKIFLFLGKEDILLIIVLLAAVMRILYQYIVLGRRK